MATLRFTTIIQRSPETVYATLADLAGYKAWLPSSKLYGETTKISQTPVQVGTTYLDQGTSTAMNGSITELVPAKHVGFTQTATLKRGMLNGELNVRIRYTLTPQVQGTQVVREQTVSTGGILRLLQPVLLKSIRQENERILQSLQAYLESR